MSIKKSLALILLSCVLLSACTPTGTPSSSEIPSESTAPSSNSTENGVLLPEPVSLEKSGVNISVQPVIELLAVIQTLSDYNDNFGLITPYDITYKKDVETYFAGMKDSEAVKFFNYAMMNDFSFDLPPAAALTINRDFTLDQTALDSSGYYDRTTINFDEFIKHMKTFYTESNFAKFYNDHAEYYRTIIDNTAANFPEWNMISVMEDFYGKKLGSYNLVLSSMFHPGGFGASLQRASGLDVYSIQGPVDAETSMPNFGGTDSFSQLALHEFGHSFLPITEATFDMTEIYDALVRTTYLHEPIREDMERSAYPEWNYSAEELVLRAIVIRMSVENQNANAEELMQIEKENGFIYIKSAYDSLQKYIDNRADYGTFDEFIPTILDDVAAAHPQGK